MSFREYQVPRRFEELGEWTDDIIVNLVTDGMYIDHCDQSNCSVSDIQCSDCLFGGDVDVIEYINVKRVVDALDELGL